MKPLHFVKRYNLSKGTQFSHKRFAVDFGNDFQSRLELYKTYNSWNHSRFLLLIDEAWKIWSNINNKTAGNLPETLWIWMYYNIILPIKAKEFPEIAKQEEQIDEMDIKKLQNYLMSKFVNDDRFLFISTYIENADMEWDHYGADSSLGDLQIRPNRAYVLVEQEIEKSNDYLIKYAFDNLSYQLNKRGHARAKIQFNIHRKRKDSKLFDWFEFATNQMYGLFNESEYDPYFSIMQITDRKELTKEKISAQYRILSQKFHPDKGGSSEKFIELTESKNKCIEYVMIKEKKLN